VKVAATSAGPQRGTDPIVDSRIRPQELHESGHDRTCPGDGSREAELPAAAGRSYWTRGHRGVTVS